MPQTLYLKYRPQDFDSVIGQEIARITLKNASKDGKLSHAYLFTGPRGTGKTSMARIVAKAINCLTPKPDGNPCNTCSICMAITEGRLVDIIEMDAASHTFVDDIRDLIDKARFMPNEAKKKVYIIDEVHMLSKSAFNALLKTLEEPPDHVHFVLATTEIHKVPETIISRCQRFDFKRIEIKDIVYQLKAIAEKEGIEYEIKALNLIAKVAEGGMRNALGIFEKVVTGNKISYDSVVDQLDVTGIHVIEGIYDDIENKRLQQALIKVNDLYESGASLTQFTKDFIEYLREKLLESIQDEDRNKSYDVLRSIDILEKASQDLKNAIIPQLPLEIAITRICMKDLDDMDQPIIKEEKKKDKEKDKKIEKKDEKTIPKEVPVQPDVQTRDKEVAPLLELSLQNLRDHWHAICQKLSPKYKHASKDAIPLTLEEDGTLTLGIHSKTYLELLKSAAARREIEKGITQLFVSGVTVKPVLQKMEPIVAERNELQKREVSAEDVAELYGGSILDS